MGNLQQDIERFLRTNLAFLQPGGGTKIPSDTKNPELQDRELIEIKTKPSTEVDLTATPLQDDSLSTAPPTYQPRLFKMTHPGLTLEVIKTADQQQIQRLDLLITKIKLADNTTKKNDLLKKYLTSPDPRLAQAMMYSPVIEDFFKQPELDKLWEKHLDNKSYKNDNQSHDGNHCDHWYRCYLNHELSLWNKAPWKNHNDVQSLQKLCESLNEAAVTRQSSMVASG